MPVEAMTIERFRALADAYGGTIARWPEPVRAAAAARAADPAAHAILVEAGTLDAALDRWTVAAPADALRTRVLAAQARRRDWTRRARLWWSGIGVASALAGAAAGSVAATAAAPAPAETVTAFGDLGGQED